MAHAGGGRVLDERAAVPERAHAHELRGNARVAFARPFILPLAAIYFVNQVTSVAVRYDFPSSSRRSASTEPFMVGLVAGGVGHRRAGRCAHRPAVKRRVRNEVRLIAVCSVAGTACIPLRLRVRPGAQDRAHRPRLGFLIGVLPLFWSLAMARMSGLIAAASLAFINTVGILGGFVGPYVYGGPRNRSGARGRVGRSWPSGWSACCCSRC